MSKLQFPGDFIFGTAAAAYQIEGAVDVDGRGVSVWDTFSHKKGKIRHGENGDVACDHYHRYREDVGLMQTLGLDAYRLSIAWPRILPNGTGSVNEKGLDFYRRLIDELLAADITPFVTLFHWDMPQALNQRYGGFLSRQAAIDYADYVEVVVRALGDRVQHWITLNEPWEHGCFGYVMGEHAPGKVRPWSYLKVMHHQLLAHGMGMERIRTHCPDAEAGITLSFTPIHPLSDSERDRGAAQLGNEFMNFITLDPLLKGHYPKELWRRLRLFQPKIEARDWDIIQTPVDFIGVNYYSREFARYRRWVPFLQAWIEGGGEVAQGDFVRDGVQHTAMGWEVYPEGIYEVLNWLHRDYGNPRVYVTENGAAFDDVLVDGVVDDPRRIAFLQAYLGEIKRAMDEGADVNGYFVWSLMDNFEWAVGYDKRFGLIHVDYPTQQRTLKNSAYWYRDLIADHR